MKHLGSLFLALILIVLTSYSLPNTANAQDDESLSGTEQADNAEQADNSRLSLDDPDEPDDARITLDDNSDIDVIADKNDDSPVLGHGFGLGMSFVGVPNGILDAWFSKHGSLWSGGAVNMGFSFDYFLRFKVPCEMRFSLSWVNGRTGDAYWLDKDYADRTYLADYIVNNHSLVNLEVAAYHIIPIIDEIAFYYGGGIWGGVVLDDSRGYAIRSSCALYADDITQCPHEPGHVPLTQMPKVFGFVMVTLGFKFTVLDILTIRAEGGFKGYFYGQLGVGVEF